MVSIMHKKMTITLDEDVYYGLYRMIGRRKISQFIEELVRPHVVDKTLEEGYKAMALDEEREKEAMQWCNGIAGDMANETR